MIEINPSNNIYFAFINDSSFIAHWQKKLESFPTAIVSHCRKFQKDIDQKRRFLGYWLLRQHLIDNNLEEKNLLYISHNKFQKPFFDNLPNIFFNLSYSGDMAICAFSSHPIGIDTEQINTKIDLENFKSVFAPNTWAEIMASTNPIHTFYSRWTQMEAVSKADGHGITGPIQQIQYGIKTILFNNTEHEYIFIPTTENYITHVVGKNLSDINIQQKYT